MYIQQSDRHKFTADIKRTLWLIFAAKWIKLIFPSQQMSNLNTLFHLKSAYTLRAIDGPSSLQARG